MRGNQSQYSQRMLQNKQHMSRSFEKVLRCSKGFLSGSILPELTLPVIPLLFKKTKQKKTFMFKGCQCGEQQHYDGLLLMQMGLTVCPEGVCFSHVCKHLWL